MKNIVIFVLSLFLLLGCTSKNSVEPQHSVNTGMVIGSTLGAILGGLSGGMLGLLATGDGTGALIGVAVGAVSFGITGGALGSSVSEHTP